MDKKIAAAAVVAVAAVMGLILFRKQAAPTEAVMQVPRGPAPSMRFWFGKDPNAELLRLGVDETLDLRVTLGGPAFIYVLDSHDSSAPTLIWEPSATDPAFEPGEYASEGVTLVGDGAHQLLAIASPVRVNELRSAESMVPDVLSRICEQCSFQQLTVQKLAGKVTASVIPPEQPEPPPAPARGN